MYKSTKAYKVLINHTEVHLTFKWIWGLSCQYKPIVFFWLLLKGRLAQENFSKGRTWISPLMIMSCAPNLRRKPWNTYSSSVTSQELASLVLILALTPMVNSLLQRDYNIFYIIYSYDHLKLFLSTGYSVMHMYY